MRSDLGYLRGPARQQLAGGLLFRDDAGRVPSVGPTYQPNRETPGGAATVVSPALARRPASVVHAADHGRLALRGHGHPVA